MKSSLSISSGKGLDSVIGLNSIEQPKKLRNVNEYFFGEDQSRYILEINHNGLNNVEKILKNNNVYFEKIGVTQEKFFEINGDFKIDINVLYKINNEWYNKY